jgi:1-acyl-sn-glycerol-3-phosphate acyltransferase
MNAWVLISLTLILLLFPWVLVGRSSRSKTGRDVTDFPGHLGVLHWLMKLYCSVWHRLEFNQGTPLPQVGPAILICNHTCGIDHMLLQAASNRLLGFVIAKEYYDSPLLNGFCKTAGCIPVNRDGRDVTAIRAALRALKEGRVVPIFPEGRITPSSGERLGEIKSGSAYIAIRSRAPVVPAFILGTPPTDEIVDSLMTPSRSSVIFGPPIDLRDIDPHRAGDKSVQAEVCQRFKKALLSLQAQAVSHRQKARENGYNGSAWN